MSKVDKF